MTREEGLRVECERQEREKDTASLETPITPAVNTATEPPITRMLIQSDEEEVVPASPEQWLYSGPKREPSHNDFLIDFGAATSVCQTKARRQLGRKTQKT